MAEMPAATGSRKSRPLVLALGASLALNLALGAFEIRRTWRKGGLRYIAGQVGRGEPAPPPRLDFQKGLEERFRKLPASTGGVLLAGDSLVHDGPWAEVFGAIRARGIGGETTAGLLGRLDEITARRPGALFLLVGTNDLAAETGEAAILRDYRRILERVDAESPATQIYVMSVLPVDQDRPAGPVHDNGSIRSLNDGLRALAGEFPRARFLDVHDALAGPDGRLRAEYTTDGLHLTLGGYLRLCEAIAGAVRPHLPGPNP